MDTWQGHMGQLITQDYSKKGFPLLDCGNNPEEGRTGMKKSLFLHFLCNTPRKKKNKQIMSAWINDMDQWHGSIVLVDRQGKFWETHMDNGLWIMDHVWITSLDASKEKTKQ